MRELVCPQAGLLRVGLLRQLVHAGVDDVNVSLQRRFEELAPRLALRRQFASRHLHTQVPRGQLVTFVRRTHTAREFWVADWQGREGGRTLAATRMSGPAPSSSNTASRCARRMHPVVIAQMRALQPSAQDVDGWG
jgi:hypothetical protein